MLHKLLIAALMLILHMPLAYYVLTLYPSLRPGQSLADLPMGSLLLIGALFALPYVVLALFGIRWNPQRARLGEPENGVF